ncbi:hypothetical protein ABIE66_003012 [Peribacillus sp. B2I2]
MVEIRGKWSRWFPFKANLMQQKLDGTANKRLVQMGTLQWTCSYIGCLAGIIRNTLLYMYKKNYDTTIPFFNKDSSVIGKDSETR